MDERIADGSGCQLSLKDGISMYFLFAGVLFLQIPSPPTSDEYVARWLGPVLTSAASLVATVFAYMTARDSKKYDANRMLMEERLVHSEKAISECKEDRKLLQDQLNEFRNEQEEKYRLLWNEMHGGRLTAEPPDNDNPDERRGPPNPDYRGPMRRADDPKKGSRESRALPKPKPKKPGSEGS